ncbi:MAG TPA: hypothetical protein VLB47_05390, partial [Solirubrobacteraceae bacterium]|nr:hypothetical protein [Solirubrobacteraceae bacterium]
TLRLDGRERPVRGALVRAAGRRARTDAAGRARLPLGRPAGARVAVSARKAQLRPARVVVVAAPPPPRLTG